MRQASVSRSELSESVRALATEILSRVDTDRSYADVLLDHRLRKSTLDARDRALLTQLVYGTLRWRGRIDWHLGQYLRRPLSATPPYLRNLLRLTLYQLLFLRKIPVYAAVDEGVELAKQFGGKKAGGLVNALTRRILAEKDRLKLPDQMDPLQHLSVVWSHPPWIVQRWIAAYGTEATEALLKANNEESPLVLRVNRLRMERGALLQKLHEHGIDAEAAPFSPDGIRVKPGAPVQALPGYAEGFFQVQGEASQLIGYLLDPKRGARVLDACAAPGGKTTHLTELMQDTGEVTATDISSRGLEKLRQNVQRLALRSIRCFCLDVTKGLPENLAGPYDRILVDAPCTGLGTLRSHPEAKWQREEGDIHRLSRLQKKIVHQLFPHLKPGGVLVYATCTLTREENEKVVEDFLDRQADFILEDARSYLPREARRLTSGKYFLALPHRDNTDGFFGARMRKIG